MKHLDFVDELNKFGVHLSSTNIEGKGKEFEISELFKNATIIAKDFMLKWKEKRFDGRSPIKSLLKKAIDMDTWQHSWHMEIEPENYKEVEEIIQGKIIKRAEDINELMSIYFQLHYEMSK